MKQITFMYSTSIYKGNTTLSSNLPSPVCFSCMLCLWSWILKHTTKGRTYLQSFGHLRKCDTPCDSILSIAEGKYHLNYCGKMKSYFKKPKNTVAYNLIFLPKGFSVNPLGMLHMSILVYYV